MIVNNVRVYHIAIFHSQKAMFHNSKEPHKNVIKLLVNKWKGHVFSLYIMPVHVKQQCSITQKATFD